MSGGGIDLADVRAGVLTRPGQGGIESPLILVVDADAKGLWRDVNDLLDQGYDVVESADAAEAMHILAGRGDFDAMLVDIDPSSAPGGLALVRYAARHCPSMRTIVGTSGIDTDVEAAAQPARALRKPLYDRGSDDGRAADACGRGPDTMKGATMPTTRTTVSFASAFRLPGEKDRQPAGEYTVDVDVQPIDGLSFLASRRVGAFLYLPAGSDVGTCRFAVPLTVPEFDALVEAGAGGAGIRPDCSPDSNPAGFSRNGRR